MFAIQRIGVLVLLGNEQENERAQQRREEDDR